MKRWKALLLVLFAVAIAAIYGAVLIRHGFSATEEPSTLEKIVARTVRNLSIPRKAQTSRTAALFVTATTAAARPKSAGTSTPSRLICARHKRRILPMARSATSSRTASVSRACRPGAIRTKNRTTIAGNSFSSSATCANCLPARNCHSHDRQVQNPKFLHVPSRA